MGDALFEEGRTVVAVSGPKCGAGRLSALPAANKPGSGADLVVGLLRACLRPSCSRTAAQ